jgi:protein-S-isoprenylcysteine O-methyltransferase Ste14
VNTYQRLFGSGPLGVACSVLLTLAAVWARAHVPGGSLGLPLLVRQLLLAAALAGTVAGAIWSTRSLPVDRRGRGLCVAGAYRWVRHPLYAAFLSLGVPGVALYLDHWLFLVWVAALHLLWHAVVRPEEAMMRSAFGEEWERYARRTGRFVPRLLGRGGTPG